MKTISHILVVLVLGAIGCSSENQDEKEKAIDSNKLKILTDAYLFGYPMLTMHYTHLTSTNVKQNNRMGKAPLNQWAGMDKFPKAGFTSVVRPNLDTYYSLIYADLEDEALYIHIPATERYYLIPVLNAYGDVVTSLGSRTSGQGELDIALVGPEFKGEIPSDLLVVKSNTSLNWLLGRVAVRNDKDGISEVEEFQNKLVSVPLDERNNGSYLLPKGNISEENKFVPMDKVDGLSIEAFFNKMMLLMVSNPPQEGDSILMKEMAALGITPGGTFNWSQFSSQEQDLIRQIPNKVQEQFTNTTAKPKAELMQNGWMVNTMGLGNYGTDYALRAYVSKIGYGANEPIDAVYPNSAIDANGNNYNGSNNYILHFEKSELPPVKGFWSITLYNKKGFLVENAIQRYNLGSMKDLTYNSDGSLDIYIQKESPEGHESNWLPSPGQGIEYELTFRMYWPMDSVLNKTWIMPGVRIQN